MQVGVQTERQQGEQVQQMLEGFSEKQIRLLLNVLAGLLLNNTTKAELNTETCIRTLHTKVTTATLQCTRQQIQNKFID